MRSSRAAAQRPGLRGAWRFAAGAASLLGALATFAAPAGAADDGLDVATDSTFVFDPAAPGVHVEVVATVRNTKPDERQGASVRRFYYSSLTLPMPAGAVDVRASSGGRDLTVEVEPTSERVTRATVLFDEDLFFGQTRELTLAYDLRGEAPRTTSFARVNPAYASFVAYGAGDAGQVSVTVSVPDGFDVETLGDDVTRSVVDGRIVLRSGEIDEPDTWYVGVSARNDEGLQRVDVDAGGVPMTIAAWPGDDEWLAFVQRDVAGGIPALERLIGRPWPLDERLTIVETVTPYLRGYAGWFIVRENKIEVGENLDDRTLLHELAHAWFNRDLFTARWVNEGLAEEYSARALGALGRAVPEPDPIDASSTNAVRLEQWSAPRQRDGGDDDAEAWAYNASWSVVHELVDEIGVEKMAAVIQAADADTMAYLPGEPTTATDDWRRLLDLLSEIGGSTRAEPLFRAHVVAPRDTATLAERAAARTEVASLASAGGEWAVPMGVRGALEAWDFAKAGRLVDDARAVLAQRDELAAAASAAALAPASSEAAYEAAADVGPVRDALARRLASVRTIVAARQRVAAPRSFVRQVGMLGRTPEVELERAATAFAADDTATADSAAALAVDLVASADELGRRRVTVTAVSGGGGLVLVAGGTLAGVRRRRRRRPATADLAGQPEHTRSLVHVDGATPDVGHAAFPPPPPVLGDRPALPPEGLPPWPPPDTGPT